MSHSITLGFNMSTAGSSPINTVANKGKVIEDNRQGIAIQRKVAGLRPMASKQNDFNIVEGKPIQFVTPADEFAAVNDDLGEEQDTALIGSDNEHESLIRVRLEAAKKENDALPAYLSRYIKQKRNGDQDVELREGENAEWMDQMTQQQRIFILKHRKIMTALNDDYSIDSLVRERGRGEMTGTWGEAQTLINAGYRWDQAGIFYHPDTTPERLAAVRQNEARYPVMEVKKMAKAQKRTGGKGGYPKKDIGGGGNKGGSRKW
ncbi:MAG: hypothetical protein NTW29_16860 [Bacteroidetes bacterium]|nr:hypothetical protein [Bacteroidota bacterium]